MPLTARSAWRRVERDVPVGLIPASDWCDSVIAEVQEVRSMLYFGSEGLAHGSKRPSVRCKPVHARPSVHSYHPANRFHLIQVRTQEFLLLA